MRAGGKVVVAGVLYEKRNERDEMCALDWRKNQVMVTTMFS